MAWISRRVVESRKARFLTILVVNIFSFSLQACEIRSPGESDANALYLPQYSSGSGISHVGSFNIQGQYAGGLIQTVAFDESRCRWVAAVSIDRNPESIVLIDFPPVGSVDSYENTKPTTLFSHPQDLSIAEIAGDRFFWLPSQSRKQVIGFKVDSVGGAIPRYELTISRKPVRGLFSTVSRDGGRLLILGAVGRGKERQQVVRVYDISTFDKRASEVDLTNVKPVHEWILAEAQQERAQWVQGFAVYSDTVYVLTGNAKKAGVKYLGTYSVSGDIESVDELPNSSSGKIMSGEVRAYEPEGLEVVSNQNGLQLAFGMAGGTKGRRTYDLWLIPLKRK